MERDQLPVDLTATLAKFGLRDEDLEAWRGSGLSRPGLDSLALGPGDRLLESPSGADVSHFVALYAPQCASRPGPVRMRGADAREDAGAPMVPGEARRVLGPDGRILIFTSGPELRDLRYP